MLNKHQLIISEDAEILPCSETATFGAYIVAYKPCIQNDRLMLNLFDENCKPVQLVAYICFEALIDDF